MTILLRSEYTSCCKQLDSAMSLFHMADHQHFALHLQHRYLNQQRASKFGYEHLKSTRYAIFTSCANLQWLCQAVSTFTILPASRQNVTLEDTDVSVHG